MPADSVGKMVSWAVFAVLVCCTVSASAGLYGKDDKVVQLTPETFDKLIVQSNGVAVVEFYAPWCGHCQKLAPHYKKASSTLQGIATVGAVDCDADGNKKLCAQYGVRGYPTVKLFGPDRQKNPYTGEYTKEPTDYQGPGNAKSLGDAVKALLTDLHIQRIKSRDELKAFLAARPEVAKVILFSSKTEPSALYKAVSGELHAGLAFAEVHESSTSLVAQYDVTSFPTLIVVKADGSDTETYKGEHKGEPLKEFLHTFYTKTAQGSGEDAKGAKEGSKGEATPKKSSVQEVGPGDLEKLDEEEAMWLLAFHGGGAGSCPEEVKRYVDAVAVMQDVVKTGVVALEDDQYGLVTRYGVPASALERNPCELQLVLLPWGDDKADLDEYVVYNGPLEGKALQAWVTEAMPNYAEEVTGATVDHFLANMGARAVPSEGGQSTNMIINPKILLLTNKQEAPGVYKALAVNYRGQANLMFGWMRSDRPENAEFMAKMNRPKLPFIAMMFFAPVDPRAVKEGGGVPVSMQPYSGPIKYNSLAQWVSKLVGAIRQDTGDSGAEPTNIDRVTSEETFKKLCTMTDKGLCVLALLDGSKDTSALQKQKHQFSSLASFREGQPLSFAWLDVTDFVADDGGYPILDILGVLKSDLPTIAVLSTKRRLNKWDDGMHVGVMANQRTAMAVEFTPSDMTSFLDAVVGGKAKMDLMQGLPTLAGEGGVAPKAPESAPELQKGPDGETILLEDEFSLSDVMTEDLDIPYMSTRTQREVEEQEEVKAKEEEGKKKKKKKKKSKKNKKKSSSEGKEEL